MKQAVFILLMDSCSLSGSQMCVTGSWTKMNKSKSKNAKEVTEKVG